QVEQLDTSIDKEAYSYWKKVMNSTFAHIQVIRDEWSVDEASNNDPIDDYDETSSVENSPQSLPLVSFDPSEVSFPATGGMATVKIVSTSESRLAFKVIKNNEVFRAKPVFGFIEPKTKTNLEVIRVPGQAKDNSLYVHWAEVPAEATDPM
ncbi:hypothetical protein PENTCL1PPCAC_8059, partial [Pristionchus entomophagus]